MERLWRPEAFCRLGAGVNTPGNSRLRDAEGLLLLCPHPQPCVEEGQGVLRVWVGSWGGVHLGDSAAVKRKASWKVVSPAHPPAVAHPCQPWTVCDGCCPGLLRDSEVGAQ